jgi:hypothetical protein
VIVSKTFQIFDIENASESDYLECKKWANDVKPLAKLFFPNRGMEKIYEGWKVTTY